MNGSKLFYSAPLSFTFGKNMMKKTTLRQLVKEAFPPVVRPKEITVHGDKCTQCSWTIEELQSERGTMLSGSGVRWLLGELSILSPEGFRWVLPSYLDAILVDDADTELAEFLAYHFTGNYGETDRIETEARINILTINQVNCLIMIMGFLRENLGEIYYSDVDQSVKTLKTRSIKLAEQGGASDR